VAQLHYAPWAISLFGGWILQALNLLAVYPFLLIVVWTAWLLISISRSRSSEIDLHYFKQTLNNALTIAVFFAVGLALFSYQSPLYLGLVLPARGGWEYAAIFLAGAIGFLILRAWLLLLAVTAAIKGEKYFYAVTFQALR
jgi:hypothetical protein